jgi:hypothetical protein
MFVYIYIYTHTHEWGLYINTVCARQRAMHNRGENKEYFSEATFRQKLALHEVLIAALLSQHIFKIFTFETSRIVQPYDFSPDILMYLTTALLIR